MFTIPLTKCFHPLFCLIVLALLFPVIANGQLTPSPANVAFVNVPVGTSSQGVTLTNTGAASITISANSITGTGFSLAGLSLPKTLNANESTSFTVTFAPTAAGAASGTLTIISNVATLTIPLSGTAVTQGGLSPNPASITFRKVQDPISHQAVTLTNNGGTRVTISADSISGTGFSVAGLALPTTLSPGMSTSFSVDFASAGIQTASGSLTITSDGSNPNLTIPLSGTVTIGALTPEYHSISFGDTAIMTTSSQTETLRNNSQGPVTISNVSASGKGFRLTSLPFPQILAAGQSTSFQVTFNPASIGPESGTVTITSPSADLSVPLSGTGVFDGNQITRFPDCSLSKTNRACKLIIDRSNPLSPSAVQMYSNQALIVLLENPKRYERYFLDYQSGQVSLLPDVTSSIVQGLLPNLAKAQEFHTALDFIRNNVAVDPCTDPAITATTTPAGGTVASEVTAFQNCFATLAQNSIDIYQDLEALVAPDSRTPPGTPIGSGDTDEIQDDITKFLTQENAISARITFISNTNKATDAVAIQQLGTLQKLADSVASDLLGYSQRISDLDALNNQSQPCTDFNDKEKDPSVQCILLEVSPDNEKVYNNMVTRTITYSLNALNMVVYSQEAVPDPTKKKLLASIPITFADSPTDKLSSLRWEASAGVFFSSLAVRSFSVAPVYSGGVITDNIVAQNVLHPTAVPFAAANYRITNDLPWSRWKTNLYWTGAVGVNPNTVSADFASGFSISWRALMFSPLWHYGHDVRLTQGFYVGESLGSGFKGTLPTQTYWKSSFALGVSIRVPSLTGR